MPNRIAHICSSAFLAFAIVTSTASPGFAESAKPAVSASGVIATKSAYDVAETVARLKKDIAAKGIGVAALAVIAASSRHWWLAAIMAAGALGDMLLELPGGLVPGGGAFAAGHVIAIIFYTRNRRGNIGTADRGFALGLIWHHSTAQITQ